MTIEIKPWVKPHLRARLIEEAKAKQPKTAQGLTDINKVPMKPNDPLTMVLNAGDRVRVKKPQRVYEGPTWASGMDPIDGQIVTVIVGTNFQPTEPTWFKAVFGGSDWVFCTEWVVEKL